VCPPKATKLKTYKLDAYKRCEFRKNSANESPVRCKFMAKIRHFEFLELYSYISAPINVKFGAGSGPPCQISRLSKRKPHFWTLSKNNTGMAAFRAGLPVIKMRDP